MDHDDDEDVIVRRTVLSRMLENFPDDERPAVAARVVGEIARLHDEHLSEGYPRWLTELLVEARATGVVALPDVPLPADAASAALSVLLRDVPEQGRDVAEVLIPSLVESLCGAHGAEPPRWVTTLRTRRARRLRRNSKPLALSPGPREDHRCSGG